MHILLLLIAFTFGFADNSGVPPGWSLTRLESETEEGTYEQRVFFSLKPADERPAITIDENTAKSIRSGKANPDAIYAAQTGGAAPGAETTAAAASEEKEYVYGAANNGVAQADPILSTATLDQRPAESEAPPVQQQQAAAPAFRQPFAPIAANAPAQPQRFQPPPRNTSGASGLPVVAAPVTPPAPAAAPIAAASPSAPSAVAEKKKNTELDKVPEPGKLKILAPTINASNVAMGFGVRQPSSKNQGGKGGGLVDSATGEKIEDFGPCVEGKKIITTPSRLRLSARGCRGVMITAWGAGGGAGASGDPTIGQQVSPGGAGAFVGVVADLDGKSDLVVVVGAAGGNGSSDAGGAGGLPGGGAGGSSSNAGGGGGGGFTGVFTVDRNEGGTPTRPALALAVAAGGGGGAGRGGAGGGGGVEQGEGGSRGASQVGGGVASGNATGGGAVSGGIGGNGLASCSANRTGADGKRYCTIQDSESIVEVLEDYTSAGGGGGGGGFFGGAGGAGVGAGDSTPGGGGSSFGKGTGNASPAQGTTPGFNFHPERGGAGAAGGHGKLIVEWF
jgi:hypothetical protein